MYLLIVHKYLLYLGILLYILSEINFENETHISSNFKFFLITTKAIKVSHNDDDVMTSHTSI